MSTSLFLILSFICGVIILITLMWKNKTDEKVINPDAEDAVEEEKMDHDRNKDRT